MGEQNVSHTEFETFVKHAEKDHAMYEKKLEKLDGLSDNMIELTASVNHLSVNVDKLSTSIQEMDKRMDAIEKEPLELIKQNNITLKRACVAAVATAICTSILWVIIQQLAASIPH